MSLADRELLELAAKASGMETNHPWNESRMALSPPVVSLVVHQGGELVSTAWNPLASDRDALRLAVKLNFEIERSKLADRAYVGSVDDAPWVEYVSYEQDIYACTRRAIVCAAAEIGKSMSAAVCTSEEGK